MPRIELAFWHGKHKPGDVIQVTEDEVRALRRDGRVARVLPDVPPPAPVAPTAEEQPTAKRTRG